MRTRVGDATDARRAKYDNASPSKFEPYGLGHGIRLRADMRQAVDMKLGVGDG